MDERKASATSQFRPEELTEGDIESIWKNMMAGKGTKTASKTGRNPTSIDTTPTTDYGGNLIPLHPETLEEELKQDQELARMTSVLRSKKLKPKSYLPQVILYDNVSHDRMLNMKLGELRDAHRAEERRAKRRQESFVRALERKQDEWHRRDARNVAKLEPENLRELTFTFGRLYNKPDFPYQAAIQTLSTKQPPARVLMDHARRRPTILPQVTNRPIYDDEEEEDKTFITKLPKMHTMRRTNDDRDIEVTKNKPPLDRAKGSVKRRERRQRHEKRRDDWTSDTRFKTLTDLLGERYSPQKKVRPRVSTKTEPPGMLQPIL